MKELSLHILDIANNSVRAGASHVAVSLVQVAETLTFSVTDDGCGMTEAFLSEVKDPFTTSRTTRKVGMGIPLLTLAAEQTGGGVTITSRTGADHGTVITAVFHTDHIDCMPLGDMADTVATLVGGAPDVSWNFRHKTQGGDVCLSTDEIRQVLGPDVPLDTPEVLLWIRESLKEEYLNLYSK